MGVSCALSGKGRSRLSGRKLNCVPRKFIHLYSSLAAIQHIIIDTGNSCSELRTSLHSLDKLSTDSTRRLDTTYYSILEKLSTLQGTINALRELSSLTRSLTSDFETEAADVVEDITAQLETFSTGLGDQEDKIQTLGERVKGGRQKVRVLGDRLESVRARVEGWERSENEWQVTARRRLRVLWVGVVVVVVLVVIVVLGLVVWEYSPARVVEEGVVQGVDIAEGVRRVQGLVVNETVDLKKAVGETIGDLAARREEVGEDPRLRLFDEL